MAKRIVFASTALALLAGFGTQVQAAPAEAAPAADSCLSAPKGAAPKGQHWYYHVDRASHRKCWYLRDLIASEHKPAISASTAKAEAAQEADTPPPKAAAKPPKPAARSRATTPDAPRQAVRQSPAPQAQSPWPEAPPKIAPVRSVPSAGETASDSAPSGNVPASDRNRPRTADASGTVPVPNQTSNTAAPEVGSDQATASPAASVWNSPPPAPKGQVGPRSAAPQTQSTTGAQNPVEQEAAASKPAPPAQPAQTAAKDTPVHGPLMENTLIFTSATILAGLAFFAFMLMRHQFLAFARKGQFADRLRTIWLQTRSKLSTVFGRKGMQVPLVPEQATMARPFFGRREQDLPRHRYEHQIK
jgi:hypothetical protein